MNNLYREAALVNNRALLQPLTGVLNGVDLSTADLDKIESEINNKIGNEVNALVTGAASTKITNEPKVKLKFSNIDSSRGIFS